MSRADFFGDTATLTIGTGVNHALFDVYIGGSLWKTFDGYSSSPGTRDIDLELTARGAHLLEIRNRRDHSLSARQDGSYDDTTYIFQFKQLLIPDTEYDAHTIRYQYDLISRLLTADY